MTCIISRGTTEGTKTHTGASARLCRHVYVSVNVACGFFVLLGLCVNITHTCASASNDTVKPAFAETVCSNNRIPHPAASASHGPLEEVVLSNVSGTRTDATDSTEKYLKH